MQKESFKMQLTLTGTLSSHCEVEELFKYEDYYVQEIEKLVLTTLKLTIKKMMAQLDFSSYTIIMQTGYEIIIPVVQGEGPCGTGSVHCVATTGTLAAPLTGASVHNEEREHQQDSNVT